MRSYKALFAHALLEDSFASFLLLVRDYFNKRK